MQNNKMRKKEDKTRPKEENDNIEAIIAVLSDLSIANFFSLRTPSNFLWLLISECSCSKSAKFYLSCFTL